MRRAAPALIAAVLALPAVADELTEDAGQVHEARLSTLKDIRRSIDQTAKPLAPLPGGADTLEAAQAQLGEASERLEPLVRRLEALHARYHASAELSSLEAERREVRRALEIGGDAYHEQLERLESAKRLEIAQQFQAIATAGPRHASFAEISDAVHVGRVGKKFHDMEGRLRAALADDEAAYQENKKQRDDERARRRAYRQAAAAGAAGLVMIIGALAGLWRRRRPGGPAGKGSVVGGAYRLERELGRGGMGVVWEATDLSLRRKCAIKQLRPELRQDPRELEQFLAEARVVAALKHPNIVEIYAIVQEAAESMLVFELVAGRPLHVALQELGRLDLKQAGALLKQVGAALDFAHGRSVIHRDLKPENIMITPQGAAKVMDFGLAHKASLTVARLTRVASSGTPPYMSPEQELGEVSRESDLYSLGVMLYEALTGALPFPGPNYLAQKRELHLVLPTQRVPALPKLVDALLLRALQPDPKGRFHSAAELLAAWPT